jgi:PII-like signaling protein
MVATVQRKRIEILVDTPLVPRIIAIVKKVDISGWSVIKIASGGGRDGRWDHDEVTGAAAKSIVLMIANEEKAGLFADEVAPLLESHGLLITIGNVEVVRGERF